MWAQSTPSSNTEKPLTIRVKDILYYAKMLSYDFRQNKNDEQLNKHVMETQQNMTVHKYTMDLQNSLVN